MYLHGRPNAGPKRPGASLSYQDGESQLSRRAMAKLGEEDAGVEKTLRGALKLREEAGTVSVVGDFFGCT